MRISENKYSLAGNSQNELTTSIINISATNIQDIALFVLAEDSDSEQKKFNLQVFRTSELPFAAVLQNVRV